MRQKTVSTVLVVLVGLWCLGFMIAPVAERALTGTAFSSQLYAGICHQDPARSFSWFGAQWAVCHRCSAIYLSFALAGIVMIVRGRTTLSGFPRPAVIAALLVPVVLDGLTDLVGLRSADLVSRIVTGTLTGVVLALVVIPVLFDALRKLDVFEPSLSPGGHDA